MLDKFFEGWYRITKLEIFNFFESLFHKSRGKGGERIGESDSEKCWWKLLMVTITTTHHHHLRRR
jgi:hypothetical protein